MLHEYSFYDTTLITVIVHCIIIFDIFGILRVKNKRFAFKFERGEFQIKPVVINMIV